MASMSYLWAHRAKFPLTSINFYRAWGKRLFSFEELVRRNYRRTRLTKKGARIHETAEIGNVLVDGPRRLLAIGSLSFVGRVNIALHAEVQIGNCVCINDGVILLTASHDVTDPEWKHKKAPIIIEDYAWVATNAIILPGVTIGKGAVVGAGAVVSKSVLPNEIVAGNPAKPIHKKRYPSLEYNPCEFLAANRAWLVG